tara:strand:- start:452 stop:769 length:318 start_codon:yes stop_codon:yes gene_type:complete
MEGLSMLNEERDIVSEIKSNIKLTKKEQIEKYMDYLLNDCNYRLPDIFLEFIAREKLDYKFTEEEIKNMREHFHRRQEELEEQNKLAVIKEEEEKLKNEIVIKEI